MPYPVCVLISVTAAAGQAEDPAALMAEVAEAYAAKNYAKCVELNDAAIKAGAFPPPALYNAACCCALDGKVSEAFAWLDKAIDAGWRDAAHMKADPDLISLHADRRWPEVIRRTEEAAAKFQPALREELLQHVEKDLRYAKDPNADMAEWTKVAVENTAYMKTVIEKYGWPGWSMVGEDGADAAFLMVHHASADPPFQKKCLDLLTKAVEAKEAAPDDLAYLTDRVLLAEGKPQRYGTQLDTVNGKVQPAPVEDEANLDARRKAVGLPPIADYIKQHKAFHGDKP